MSKEEAAVTTTMVVPKAFLTAMGINLMIYILLIVIQCGKEIIWTTTTTTSTSQQQQQQLSFTTNYNIKSPEMNDMDDLRIVIPPPPPPADIVSDTQAMEHYNQLHNMIQRLQSTILQIQEQYQNLQLFQKQQELYHHHHQLESLLSNTATVIPTIKLSDHVVSLFEQLKQQQSQLHPSVVSSHWNNIKRTVIPKFIPELDQLRIKKDWNSIQYIWDELIQQQQQLNQMNTTANTTTTTTSTTVNDVGQCTKAPLSSTTATHLNYATHDQLQTYITNLREHVLLLSQQPSKILPLSFPTSVQTLQQYLQQIWNETITNNTILIIDQEEEMMGDEIADEATTYLDDSSSGISDDMDNSNNNNNCLPSIDWIHEWMDVGFDTIYRNTSLDIRRELIQAIYQQQQQHHSNIDMTNIRLDIPSFVTKYQTQMVQSVAESSSTTKRYNNLRQFLDRPSIYELSIYIDYILDFISGRNNQLDDIMDRYLYSNPQLIREGSYCITPRSTFTTTTTTVPPIGPIIIAHMMNLLGHVPVPSKTTIMNIISKLGLAR